MMACEFTTLAHESWNDSVKAGTLITKSFLSSAQSTKVFCFLSNFVCKQVQGDVTQGFAINSDVKEHSEVDPGWHQVATGDSSVCKVAHKCFLK
jgi:hypothetical protein